MTHAAATTMTRSGARRRIATIKATIQQSRSSKTNWSRSWRRRVRGPRLPQRMLTNPQRYLDPLNFATNFAFFRDAGGRHTRIVTAN